MTSSSTNAANNPQLPAPLNQNHPKTQADWQQILNQFSSWQSALSVLVPPTQQTQAENGALPNPVVPVNYSYPPQTAIRYAPNVVPGTTDMALGIQAAIDSAGSGSASVLISDHNALSQPLLIRSTTVESIGLYGNARVVTELIPLGSNIATAPVSVNALIICQNNNAHLHLTHLRSADSNFTGYFMYAVPGGGSDGSCQASFSMVVDDCWFSPSQNGNGVFYGFYSNMQMSNCVFESTKAGCIRVVGGTSDILVTNVTMNGCFDAFFLGNDDTSSKAILTVDGLHAYNHFRGALFQIINGVEMHFSNITVEPNLSQISTVGLFSFTDCAMIDCHNAICHSRTGVPQGAGPAISIINGATGKFSNIIADCLIGVQFSGSGVVDLTFDNCDFSGSASLPVNIGLQILGSTQSGLVKFRNCRFNYANFQNFIHTSGVCAILFEFDNCELLNAGMNGTTTNYNIDTSLTGQVTFNQGCNIGHNAVGAAAAYYFNTNGAGSVNVNDPNINSAPPTGLFRGTQAIVWDGVNSLTPGFTTAMSLTPGGTSTLTASLNRWALKEGVVHIFADITVNTIGTGSATTLTGLPFTSSATYYGGGVAHFFSASGTLITSLTFSVSPGGTSLIFRSLAAAGAGTANNNILQNGTRVIIVGSYPL